MALIYPTYIGKDQIMKFYDAVQSDSENVLYWSLWHSEKDIACQYVGDDASKARRMLDDNLEALEQAQNTRLMYLKFHPSDKKGKYIDKSTTVVSNTPLKAFDDGNGAEVSGVSEPAPYAARRSTDMPYQMYEAINAIKELPGKMNERLTAFETRIALLEQPEEETPVEDQFSKVAGVITGIVNNPAVMGAIGQLLGYLKPLAPIVAAPLRTVNGMENPIANPEPEIFTEPEPAPVDESLVNDALNRLHKHCKIDSDLQLLANLAETDPAQFSMMLMLLRKS